MSMTTTLTSMASLSQTLQCNNKHRDASFSSFLNTEEETFIRKLTESNLKKKRDAIQQQDRVHLNQPEHHSEDEGEIGVFSAEKYFNSGMDDDDEGDDDIPKLTNTVSPVSEKYIHRSVIPDLLVKPKVQLGTPSVRSESSCNSQTALIRVPLVRTPSRKRTDKVPRKSLFAAIGCNYCSCSDKESVDVHDELKKPATDRYPVEQHKGITRQVPTKQPIRIKEEKQKIQSCQDFHNNLGCGQRKENSFAFPALSSSSGNISLKMRVLEEPKILKSPEVLRKANSFGLEKKLPWDFLTGVSAPSGGGHNDDNDSDASSDLFEIESISGKVTSGCLTPRTCYAPSEASVDWSVVTASAADFSVMSNYEHDQLRPWTSPTRESKSREATKIRNRKDKIMMGCNSQKAVKIVGDSQNKNNRCSNNGPRDLRRMSDSYVASLGRLQADQVKLAYGKSNQIAANTNLLLRSRSPNGPHYMYV